MKNTMINNLKIIALGILISIGASYVHAAFPTVAAPDGNVSTPIHLLSTAQTKLGGLTLPALIVGDYTFQVSSGGRIGIKVAPSTTNALSVNGKVRFNDLAHGQFGVLKKLCTTTSGELELCADALPVVTSLIPSVTSQSGDTLKVSGANFNTTSFAQIETSEDWWVDMTSVVNSDKSITYTLPTLPSNDATYNIRVKTSVNGNSAYLTNEATLTVKPNVVALVITIPESNTGGRRCNIGADGSCYGYIDFINEKICLNTSCSEYSALPADVNLSKPIRFEVIAGSGAGGTGYAPNVNYGAGGGGGGAGGSIVGTFTPQNNLGSGYSFRVGKGGNQAAGISSYIQERVSSTSVYTNIAEADGGGKGSNGRGGSTTGSVVGGEGGVGGSGTMGTNVSGTVYQGGTGEKGRITGYLGTADGGTGGYNAIDSNFDAGNGGKATLTQSSLTGKVGSPGKNGRITIYYETNPGYTRILPVITLFEVSKRPETYSAATTYNPNSSDNYFDLSWRTTNTASCSASTSVDNTSAGILYYRTNQAPYASPAWPYQWMNGWAYPPSGTATGISFMPQVYKPSGNQTTDVFYKLTCVGTYGGETVATINAANFIWPQ